MNNKPITAVLSDWISIPEQGLNPALYRKLMERLVFANPEYEARHLRGEWIGGVPPQIQCLRRNGRQLQLPRGFLSRFLELCEAHQQPVRLQDRRRLLPPAALAFHGYLKDYQQHGANSVLARDFAILAGGHKSGKTVIALYTIAWRAQPTLVLIPRLDLRDGWLTKIENFLQIPRAEIGLYAEGEHRLGELITLAHSGEMMRHWKSVRNRIGYLIVDECQRCPAKVFTHLVANFDSHYMLGLSNPGQHRDRLSRLAHYHVGDVVYAIDEKDAREGRGIIQAHVVARLTSFAFPYQSNADYATMLAALMQDDERNRLIADDIERQWRQRRENLLVLSGGREQNDSLRRELSKRGIAVAMPEADCPAAGGQGPAAVLLSPEQLVETCERTDAKVLFLAVPVCFRKDLTQAIQNLYRPANGNGGCLTIYDYVDRQVGLLENYFRMRSYNYGIHPDMLLSAH